VVRTDRDGNNTPLLEEAEELNRINTELIEGDCATEDDIIQAAKDADALLVVSAQITRRVNMTR
jgi:hypothetical protein